MSSFVELCQTNRVIWSKTKGKRLQSDRSRLGTWLGDRQYFDIARQLRCAGFSFTKPKRWWPVCIWPIIELNRPTLTGRFNFRERDWFSEWWRVVRTRTCYFEKLYVSLAPPLLPLLFTSIRLFTGAHRWYFVVNTVYTIKFTCCRCVCQHVNIKLRYLRCGCRWR